jgi:hypothetical protein
MIVLIFPDAGFDKQADKNVLCTNRHSGRSEAGTRNLHEELPGQAPNDAPVLSHQNRNVYD